jgi:pimeloyl-ACP methyl ester carboxylesterase
MTATPPPPVPPPGGRWPRTPAPPPSVAPPAPAAVTGTTRRRLWPWVLAAVAVLMLAAVARVAVWLLDDPYDVAAWAEANPHRAARDTSTLPLLEPHPCPFEGEPGSMSVTCATLVVPADRDAAPGSPAAATVVELPVAVLPARGPGPARADPVLYLEGGPGGSSVAWFDLWAEDGWPSDRDRDLVLLDQRGTGYALPSLGCDDVARSDPGEEAAALRVCHDAWVAAGIDLATVSTPAHAADVADLRTVLGVEEWNLLGVSYGTRVALRVLSDHPEGVRSVVLDSVYPPEVEALYEEVGNGLTAFQQLFAACDDDPVCAREHPDLATTFATLLARLDRDPVELDGTPLSGDELVLATYEALYDPSLIAELPGWLAAGADDPAALGGLVDAVGWRRARWPPSALTLSRRAADGATVPAYADSDGTFYSVECREEAATIDAEEALHRARGHDHPAAPALTRVLEQTLDTCAGWRSGRADPRERERVVSDVPALLLAGALDPVTPPSYAQRAVAGLGAGRLVEFPGAGHAVIAAGACPAALIETFLDDPAAPLDTACRLLSGPFDD